MIIHRGVGISLREATNLTVKGFNVRRADGLVYEASSVYGTAYATTAQEAVRLAEELIDRAGKVDSNG